MSTIKVFAKEIQTKSKSFISLSYVNPKNVWYSVKFTQDSGININKLAPKKYYDITFSQYEFSISTKEATNKKGDKYIDRIVWINDAKATILPHEDTEAEKEDRANRYLDELAGVEV